MLKEERCELYDRVSQITRENQTLKSNVLKSMDVRNYGINDKCYYISQVVYTPHIIERSAAMRSGTSICPVSDLIVGHAKLQPVAKIYIIPDCVCAICIGVCVNFCNWT